MLYCLQRQLSGGRGDGADRQRLCPRRVAAIADGICGRSAKAHHDQPRRERGMTADRAPASIRSLPLVANAEFSPQPREVVGAHRISGRGCADWFSSIFSHAITFFRPFAVLTALRGVWLPSAGIGRPASCDSDPSGPDERCFSAPSSGGRRTMSCSECSRDDAIICSTLCRSTRGARARPARTGSSIARPLG